MKTALITAAFTVLILFGGLLSILIISMIFLTIGFVELNF